MADRDQLRTQVKKLEATQSRVHQLEVELSDREAAHRGVIQQLEQSLAERDQRIDELVPVTHLLREKEADVKEWEKQHARTVQDHEVEVGKLQEQCAAQDQLRAQHRLDEQRLHERAEEIGSLQHRLHELHVEREHLSREVQSIPGKDEHIERLRMQLKEVRAALREKSVPADGTPRQVRHAESQPSVQLGSPKGDKSTQKDAQKDDLKKIHGIGPVFAQTLNKMGTWTFVQIARWKPDDINKIAKKLETDPERIKRENWIADAKKQHFRKYGERL